MEVEEEKTPPPVVIRLLLEVCGRALERCAAAAAPHRAPDVWTAMWTPLELVAVVVVAVAPAAAEVTELEIFPARIALK